MMASSPSVSGFLAAEKDLATLGTAILLKANIFISLLEKVSFGFIPKNNEDVQAKVATQTAASRLKSFLTQLQQY
jgi:hypothetical protein